MVAVKTKGVTTGFSPVPDDTYEVALTKVTVGPSKSTPGEFSYNLELTIQTPPDFAGRKIFYNGSLQEQALFGMKRALVALGAPEEVTEADSIDVEVAFTDLMGKVAKVTTTIRQQPGRDPQNNVKFVLDSEAEVVPAGAAGGTGGAKPKKGSW